MDTSILTNSVRLMEGVVKTLMAKLVVKDLKNAKEELALLQTTISNFITTLAAIGDKDTDTSPNDGTSIIGSAVEAAVEAIEPVLDMVNEAVDEFTGKEEVETPELVIDTLPELADELQGQEEKE